MNDEMRALVREAWGDPEVCTGFVTDDGVGSWCAFAGASEFKGASEAGSLVVALEAAP